MDHAHQDMTAEANDELAWRAFPAREQVGRAILALAIIAAVALMVYVAVSDSKWSPPAAIAAVVVQILALHRFFFPSSFTIDGEGITARYFLKTDRRLWANLRRMRHDERGVFLSTRAARSRFDPFFGLHVLFGDRRDAVLAAIREHMKAHETEAVS